MEKETVSIIIPCRNEAAYIENCINSIFECIVDKINLEVIVCDGLSTDNTLDILENLKLKFGNSLIVLKNTKQTTPYALNLGIKYSKGSTVIILGAHSVVDKNFINENLKILINHPECGCVGGILNNKYDNKISKIIGLGMSSTFGVGNANFRLENKSGYVDTVAFGAYRKTIFDKIGYFDEVLTRNQDDDFNFRLTNAGYKIWLSPTIKCDYFVRASFSKLYKQYFQYGFWKVYLNKKHKAFLSIRQLIPFFFLCFLFFGLLVSLAFNNVILYYLIIITLYISLAILFAAKKSSSLFEIPLLVYTFFILHIAYGYGFMLGIFNFIIMGRAPKADETITR